MNRPHRVVRGVLLSVTALLFASFFNAAHADNVAFDLAGPSLKVTVTRGGMTLPVSQVPTLAVGDSLRIQPELPAGQVAKYLLVTVFLRGPTNPPPDEWFQRCEIWRRDCREHGLTLVIPQGAGQLVVLFAPQTGGDFSTLVHTVQGRPGAFVRAAQELNQASLDHSRLDRYISAVQDIGAREPERLKELAPTLAHSLGIKVDEKCLDAVLSQQVSCLTRGQESLILNDAHDASLVAALTSGAASDLAMQAGNTRMLNSGAYVPYIGSLLDIARLMDSFHTAHYQYIPALIRPHEDLLSLMLNTPPSFHEPQSVLVAALPPVEDGSRAALRNPDPRKSFCVYDSPLALPVDGAPLFFAARYPRDLHLHVVSTDSTGHDLPVHVDSRVGGIIVDSTESGDAPLDAQQPAVLRGKWGFDTFEGPAYRLGVSAPDQSWRLATEDATALVIGRENTIHLVGGDPSCLSQVRVRDSAGKEIAAPWTLESGSRIALRVDLRDARSGDVSLAVGHRGPGAQQQLTARAYVEAGRLESFEFHEGDVAGTLHGTRLDLVRVLRLGSAEFAPEALASSGGADVLTLRLREGTAPIEGRAGTTVRGQVELQDGRAVALSVRVQAMRPRGTLLGVSVEDVPDKGLPLRLAGSSEFRPEATLTFSVRLDGDMRYGAHDVIEVSTLDGSASTSLGMENGLVLADPHVAVAALKPGVQLGPSGFGPIRFRVVVGGTAGAWQPLGVLVRPPVITGLVCPPAEGTLCELRGERLFLIESVASDPTLAGAIVVQDGYTGHRLTVPRPHDGRLFLRLRDDPDVVDALTVPAVPSNGGDAGSAVADH